MTAAPLIRITDALLARVAGLSFQPPVTHVYNPLIYARQPYDRYLSRFGRSPKRTLLVGMNPGPWGMSQTGIPFGDVVSVTDWLGISGAVGQPDTPHPKRPILGFACRRREVSGKRLWSWLAARFGTPEVFFRSAMVLNYCPLVFMESSGRNRTPDRLPADEKQPLLSACDAALRETVAVLKAQTVIGVGRFAAQRAEAALKGADVAVGVISHPSPANPKANRGWDRLVTAELRAMGIQW